MSGGQKGDIIHSAAAVEIYASSYDSGTPIAVKHSLNPPLLPALLQRAEQLTAVHHPFICSVYEARILGNELHIDMERMYGDVGTLMREGRGRWSEKQLVSLLLNLVDALTTLQKQVPPI